MDRINAPWEMERKLLIKAEEETDVRFGCKPEERPLEDYVRFGIVNLDKISGPSSHEVTAWLKRLLDISHAGHGGTLETSFWEAGKSQSDRCSTRSFGRRD